MNRSTGSPAQMALAILLCLAVGSSAARTLSASGGTVSTARQQQQQEQDVDHLFSVALKDQHDPAFTAYMDKVLAQAEAKSQKSPELDYLIAPELILVDHDVQELGDAVDAYEFAQEQAQAQKAAAAKGEVTAAINIHPGLFRNAATCIAQRLMRSICQLGPHFQEMVAVHPQCWVLLNS